MVLCGGKLALEFLTPIMRLPRVAERYRDKNVPERNRAGKKLCENENSRVETRLLA